MQAEVLQFPGRGKPDARKLINDSMADIRRCGWIVTIAEDFGDRVIVDAFDGEGSNYRMLIDPATIP